MPQVPAQLSKPLTPLPVLPTSPIATLEKINVIPIERADRTNFIPCISDVCPIGALHVYMSSTSSASWIAFLEEKKLLLHQQGCTIIPDIRNEDGFRIAFEDLGKQHHEKYTPRLLVRLFPSFENIIAFAGAVAKPVPDLHSDALTSLVWAISFAATKASRAVSKWRFGDVVYRKDLKRKRKRKRSWSIL